MYDLSQVKVSNSPHIRSEDNTRQIMLDVIIALVPALALAIFVFGARALVVTAVSVIGCVFFEWLYNKLLKKPCTIGNCSAIVTGMLLAYTLPVTAPLWMVLIGDLFAIVIVKSLFGGIGKNFMNPALGGRAFLMASYPVFMTMWSKVHTALPLFGSCDVTSSATPLSFLKEGRLPDVSMTDAALGMVGGCIGEVSALALLVGGVWLLYRRVISLRIPVAFIGTVAVLTLIFPKGDGGAFTWMAYELLSGGLMLGAIFMATDYASSPVTPRGQIIYGIGCGVLTVLIRYFGSYPEGVSYAILIMNCCVFLIEKISQPVKFGYVKPVKAPKAEKEAAK
ncbi:MAG: RnfABCDGE type electron transport complex subunit D [Clostridiaceae bacterium]|nr:RnfABCDGE type electron transport complex subunit D [Clostridia bacterium]MDY3871510.1 RnfABCDGE type electron transport complex subunit D [Clostridiaceae bacterium]